MPYINQDAIDQLRRGKPASTPGELNYMLTLHIKDYWSRTGNYQGINDIVGALEGAKLEFYRRIAVPYENKKIDENGDVYEAS